MTTSLITFENTFRQRLLDIVYAQWATLGAPFSTRTPPVAHEVIDPESLLWCSLEFMPTEPRLAETVLEWLDTKGDYIVRQRICRKSSGNDPRSIIWEALEERPRPEVAVEPSLEPCHGLDSVTQVIEFAQSIKECHTRNSLPHRLGHFGAGSATLLLRARDLVGQDIRHFLLVYLLANPHGGKLREIQQWSGYSYRSLAAAAARWEAANAAILDHGYCHLTASEPWRALLHIRTSKIVIVNWSHLFEVSVRLLRDLAKARGKGLGEESPIHAVLRREAATKLASASAHWVRGANSSIGYLLSILPNVE